MYNLNRDWGSGGLKALGIHIPVFQTTLVYGDALYTTDLKVRGYLNSRLPDEFPIVSSIREDNRMIGNRRLKDAVPDGRIAAGF